MSIVILILDHCLAVFRNTRAHELANHATEIGWHQHLFKSNHVFATKLLVNEAEKIYEFLHPFADVIYCDAKRNFGIGIETSRVQWFRRPDRRRFVGHPDGIIGEIN